MSGLVMVPLILLCAISFVLFGQITVRRLRRNPETKEYLGLDIMSGWDIFNVAVSLSLPKIITNKIEENKWGFVEANRTVLDKYTNWFDRLLARIVFFSWVTTTAIVLWLFVFDFG